MSDEFIVEEEAGASSFLMVVAALVGIFLLGLLCIGTLFVLNGNGNGGEEDPAFQTRIAENQSIAATNTAVFETRAAIETEAARPTDTPAPTNTPPPSPTATATNTPTETPVIQPPGDGTATPDLAGTSIFGGVLGTPTPISGTGNGSGSGALPKTGIGAWGALAMAVFFSLLLVVVRRLRTG